MAKLPSVATKGIVVVVVLAIVAVGAYYAFFKSDDTRTVKANFPEAIGIYIGTPVRIDGVKVGEVTGIQTEAQYVQVSMSYDAQYRLGAQDAVAEAFANSLVSDRYIGLGPLLQPDSSTEALADNAVLSGDKHVVVPEELDDIYGALDKLSVALGPAGANKNGALSALLKVSAANLKGNGAALGQSITNLAQAAQTLSDRKDGLFGTVKNLEKFTSALKSSDSQVRLFNSQLATVAGDLAAERSDLGAALQQLGLALDSVSTFVKANAKKFHIDIKGLEDITNLLVRQKASLNETLAIAPVALANIVHAYQPDLGAIGTRSNLASLTAGLTPAELTAKICGLLTSTTGVVTGTGGLAGLLGGLGSTVTGLLNAACPAAKTGASSKSTSIQAVLNGGVAPGQLIGSRK